MLINDSEVQAKHKILNPLAKHEAETKEWLEQEAKACALVNLDFNPTNPEQQLGRSYMSKDFERLLQPMLPANIKILDHPFRKGWRWIARLMPNQQLDSLGIPFEAGLLPEHSIMEPKVEWVRDPSQRHLHRADLPKYEITPAGTLWESGAKPGWKKVAKMGAEKKRGWRTILMRLVQAGVLTPQQVERKFGADDRVQWANGLGKRSIISEL